jgi:uncharacterized membrane protein
MKKIKKPEKKTNKVVQFFERNAEKVVFIHSEKKSNKKRIPSLIFLKIRSFIELFLLFFLSVLSYGVLREVFGLGDTTASIFVFFFLAFSSVQLAFIHKERERQRILLTSFKLAGVSLDK